MNDSMKIAAWNIRGMCDRDKQKEMRKFISTEKLSVCAILETHIKEKKLKRICEFVYGNWAWNSNIAYSDRGCRIIVGWNEDDVDLMVVHSSRQSMLCLIEILHTKQNF